MKTSFNTWSQSLISIEKAFHARIQTSNIFEARDSMIIHSTSPHQTHAGSILLSTSPHQCSSRMQAPPPAQMANNQNATQQQHVSSSLLRRRTNKRDIALLYCAKLAERGEFNDVHEPGFQEAMVRHFETLPTRYALDVNLDSLDVLSHQKLLNEARHDQTSVSYSVRPVEILVDRAHHAPRSGSGVPGDSQSYMPISPQVNAWFVVCE